MPQIRILTPTDAPVYYQLRLQGFHDFPEAFTSDYEAEKKKTPDDYAYRLDARLAGAMLFTLGAFTDDDELVGILYFSQNDRKKEQHIGEINGFVVKKAQQGRGIGRQLLNRALFLIQQNKVIEQVNLSVSSNNENAIRLYQSFGFEEYGFERNALKIGGRYVHKLLLSLVI
jgi:ribosomal protein S18 acetylase RimI-like enzyme